MAEFGRRLETFNEDPYTIFNPTSSDRLVTDRNISLNQVTTYIYQSMQDFQGKWESTDRGPLTIKMPNARYLAIGDEITNLSTGKKYFIVEVISEAGKGGMIRLKDTGAPAPKLGDFLALEEKNTVNFVSSYSRYYQDRPVEEWRDTVIYRVRRREAGSVSKHPFSSPTELKPRIRETLVDKEHPGCHIAVMGQWFDNLIQFDVWSKYNNRADELIEWFEDFMYKYTWVWKKNGVNEILYWSRNTDEESTKFRNDLAVRTVIYYFKTETIVNIKEYDLKQVDLYLALDNAVASGAIGVNDESLISASGYIEVLDRGFSAYEN